MECGLMELIFFGLILAVIFIILFTTVRVVKQGYVYTIERLGRFTTAADPGLHILIPFLDRVGQKVNMMEQVHNLYAAIMAITTTNLRTVMGSMDLDETLSRRDEINARLLGVVDHATSPWGPKITRVEIKDIRPPHDISEAMARQMKAERLKRAETLDAGGERPSRILRAEGEKQSATLS